MSRGGGDLDEVKSLRQQLRAARLMLEQREAARSVLVNDLVDLVLSGRMTRQEAWSSGIVLASTRVDGTVDVEALDRAVAASVGGVT